MSMLVEWLRPQRAKSTRPTPPPIAFRRAIFRTRTTGGCCFDSAPDVWRVCVHVSSGQDGGRRGDVRHGGLRTSRRSALFVVPFVLPLAGAANAAASRLVAEGGVVGQGSQDGMEHGVGRHGRRGAGRTRDERDDRDKRRAERDGAWRKEA